MSNKKPLTFGLLIMNVVEPHITGSIYAADRLGVNLVVFPGQIIQSQDKYYAQENIIYEFITKERIDGLIIDIGGLNWYITREEMMSFIDRYKPIPIITMGASFEGIPSILLDDFIGMKRAVDHLIEVHGFKRIAFLRGSEGHHAECERYRGYEESLKEHGIDVEDELVSPVNITWNNLESIKILFDERKVNCEALVMANVGYISDILAFFESKNIKIPRDLAIVGFDNDPATEVLQSPLTVVDPQLHRMGRRAVELLAEKINGESIPDIENMEPELIIRNSCGCPTKACIYAGACQENETQFCRQDNSIHSQLDGEIKKAIGNTIDEMNRDGRDILYEGFLSQAAGENDKNYFSILDDFLEKTALLGGNVNAWQSVVSAIRNKSINESGIHRLKLETMENIFNQSRVMISEKALRNIAYRQILDDKMYSHVNSVCRDLMIHFDIDAIMDVAADEFPKLNISSCYINIYENPDKPSEFSRLIMAYDKKGRIKLKQGGLIFATTEIIPDEITPIDQKINLFLMDLYFQKEQIGYIVFSDGAKDARFYETFRTIISSSLKGALLVRQITDHAKELFHINEKLKFSNAELEQFAYIASHDLQEPLRKITAFGNILKNKYDNVLEDQGRDYIERMQNAASRMQQLIDDLLAYSRMTTNPEPFSSVDLSLIVKDVLFDLEVSIEKNQGRVEVGELPVIEAYPIKIRQLFQNLIGNALKFHRPEIPPVVKIYASQGMPQGFCRLIVEDNGIGIAEEDYEKLFKVFRRLHGRGAYEGSGIGLAVCKKIVEQHGGTIEVRSAIGAGTKFIFDLPVKI